MEPLQREQSVPSGRDAPSSSPVPLPENIPSVQPGGGLCYTLELAWGRCRRWYLRRFRGGYVARMAKLRRGDPSDAPHEILDPRDLKYCRNICNAHWDAKDDPFHWRNDLPLVRWGLAEVLLTTTPLLAISAAALLLPSPFPWLGVVPAGVAALCLYFFRNPRRRVPDQTGQLVAPADGRIVEIRRIEHDDFIEGPAVCIGIFLSIFNVHINRAPERCLVIELRYRPGEFLNALNPQSVVRNESMWIGLETSTRPHRRIIVRQISGLIARRIVCAIRPGQEVDRGEQIGMIKLGSRTELILPAGDVEVRVAEGQTVKAGETVLATFHVPEKDGVE